MRKAALFVEPIVHCRENGGSYWVHAKNGMIKSFMGLGIFLTGIIHSIFPFLLPFVAEHLLAKLIVRTRNDLKSYGHHEEASKWYLSNY